MFEEEPREGLDLDKYKKIQDAKEKPYVDAIAYLEKCLEKQEERVESLTRALGDEIGKAQLFSLAVSTSSILTKLTIL